MKERWKGGGYAQNNNPIPKKFKADILKIMFVVTWGRVSMDSVETILSEYDKMGVWINQNYTWLCVHLLLLLLLLSEGLQQLLQLVRRGGRHFLSLG